MEENKNIPPKAPMQGGNNQNGGGNGGNGGRKRRKKKHKSGGNNQSGQNQNNQNGQNKPQQNQNNKPQGQNNNQKGQNGQNGGNKNNQGNQNAQNQNKNKGQQNQNNKPQQPQNNKPQNQNNQNNKGQNQGQNQNKPKQNQNQNNQNKDKDENRKDTYVYVLDGNLYINLTNKCSNGCDFCVRNERTSYYGNYLWLKHGEPTVEKVIAAANGLGDISRFKEAVFCGFGEPTYKVAEMVALCDYFHNKGLKTRLNTNGQGNLINKRDIVPDLKGKIDLVNVSLNASCAEKYQKICRSQFREMAFDAIIEFAKICRRNGVNCRFSIVDCIGEEEVEACKRVAEKTRVPLYIRSYISDS